MKKLILLFSILLTGCDGEAVFNEMTPKINPGMRATFEANPGQIIIEQTQPVGVTLGTNTHYVQAGNKYFDRVTNDRKIAHPLAGCYHHWNFTQLFGVDAEFWHNQQYTLTLIPDLWTCNYATQENRCKSAGEPVRQADGWHVPVYCEVFAKAAQKTNADVDDTVWFTSEGK